MMASLQSTFLVSSVLLAVFIHKGDAISCFECNSINDATCLQDKLPDTLSVDCNNLTPPDVYRNENKTYTFCRKIVQIIDFHADNLQPGRRVIRGCGWDNSSYNGTCHQPSRGQIYQEVCACYGDNCNGASSLLVSLGVLLFGATAFLIH